MVQIAYTLALIIINKPYRFKMNQDQHNNKPQPQPYTPKKPQSGLKHHIMLSKSKDRIQLTQNHKQRTTHRSSIKRKIALFKDSNRFEVIYKGKVVGKCEGVDEGEGQGNGGERGMANKKDQLEEWGTKLQQIISMGQRFNLQLSYWLNIITCITQTIQLLKTATLQISKKHQNWNFQKRFMQNLGNSIQLNLDFLVNYNAKIKDFVKKQLFKIFSRQGKCTYNMERIQKVFKEKQILIKQKLSELQQVTLKTKQCQMSAKDIKMQKAVALKQLHQTTKKYQKQISQLFVLRIQINCNLFGGFMASHGGIDKRMILRKEFVNWDRTKQKKVTPMDMKRWVVLQLYQGWRGVLRKLSFMSSHYQVMFGEISDEAVFKSLMMTLQHQSGRASNKKVNKLISIHNDLKVPTNYKQQLVNQLQNFNNGIIAIKSIQFSATVPPQPSLLSQPQSLILSESSPTHTLTCQTLHIHYTSLCSQQPLLTQKFTIEHGPVNRQRLLRDVNGGDRVFCVVEVPLIVHKDDIARYEEIWEILKKKKMVYATGVGRGGAGGLGKGKTIGKAEGLKKSKSSFSLPR